MKKAEKRESLHYFCYLIPISIRLILKSMNIYISFFFLATPTSLNLQDLKFPSQGPNPLTLRWRHRVLTTEPPGKSPNEETFYVHFRSGRFSVTTEWIGHVGEACSQASVLTVFVLINCETIHSFYGHSHDRKKMSQKKLSFISKRWRHSESIVRMIYKVFLNV